MSSTSQLMSAISSNDNETVFELLKNMNIEAINRNEEYETALHVACDKKNHDALDAMLAKTGIDVNVKDINGLTPLHTALNSNNLQAVGKLLGRLDIDVNAKSSTCGWTPLHIACNSNYLQVAAKLLDSPGIDVNVKSFLGRTPLHFACRKNLHSIVKQLLASPDIDLNARDVDGFSPIIDCVGCYNEDSLKVMLDDPRVNLDIEDKKGRRLEEKVRTSGYYSKEEKDTCLEMIKNERMRRQVREVRPEKTGQTRHIGRNIVKIEKINKEIEVEEGKRKNNLDIRKQKMEDLAKRHNEELSLLEKNQRREITVLQETSEREDHDEQRFIASLKEHRNELAEEVENLTNDASSDECSILEPIKRSLECPICSELMRPPTKIWMCRFTHVICEVCKDAITGGGGKCPTCTTEPFIGRNYMAENLARTVFNE